MSMQVAQTILQQLGGRRFIAMTGADCFIGGKDCLSMKLPSRLTKGRIRGFRITLTAMDDYTLKALHQHGSPTYKIEVIDRREGVYCDNLREVFEDMTGFRTSL